MSQPPPNRRPNILCTNDDGIHAPGLGVLTEAARRIGSVVVVAPDREQSATSHSLTVNRPLRVTRRDEDTHVVDGTPTDCVLIAVNSLLDIRPDFVFSGVNHGPNMGEDVLYSGTVAAAMEGTILGIPSVAVSLSSRSSDNLEGFVEILARLLRGLVERTDFPDETFFNINLPDIPAEEIKGARITTLGRRVYSDSLTRREDPSGREYFWIGGGVSSWSGRDDSDFRAVRAGFASVTPLHLDLTNYRLMKEVEGWSLPI
ncbi:MAG: 5'/3'-nucleotidase SurE [marine benthic group bacterium]|nr:5'/3'-nucleotidase SurE [Gemmatimonadota bacterium]MCL7961738.1 5'/3'-nucleotidase SurE [Candidatus Carthagonibacter metallireducens]MCL7964405.1 5'/3'-nucleotidase SurE [Gemmatimonadota bacterium]MCL7973655.1 5'/3'-nucleotidase SurE [Gemmatimonadota bacterium]MCL7977454.1 5'/3'-nucleotidase SurE [Gemmatimonadota bacterium]